jgi:hypothetical protein
LRFNDGIDNAFHSSEMRCGIMGSGLDIGQTSHDGEMRRRGNEEMGGWEDGNMRRQDLAR